jgi:type IV secretion system protein VirB1
MAGRRRTVWLFEQRCALLLAAGAAWAACGLPRAAGAAPLSAAEVAALTARCAPSGPEATLEAVAQTESGLDPWALHDNTTNASVAPANLRVALIDARQWIGRGHSVDLGLMQINSANLTALGMTIRSALDSCASLAGGAAVLHAAYGDAQTSAEQQAALLMALSRYSTGSPFKGILNGYARRVIANAATAAPPSSPVQTTTLEDPKAPPSWDVWATAAYAQAHGAAWLIPLSPGASNRAQAQQPPDGNPPPMSPAAAGVVAIVGTSSTQQPQRAR